MLGWGLDHNDMKAAGQSDASRHNAGEIKTTA